MPFSREAISESLVSPLEKSAITMSQKVLEGAFTLAAGYWIGILY